MALRWDCVCCLSCDATGKAGRGSRVGGGGLSSRCFIAHLAFYSLELTTDLHLTLAVPVSVSLYVYVFVCVCMCLPVRVFICVSVLLILAVCVCMCLCTRSGGMHKTKPKLRQCAGEGTRLGPGCGRPPSQLGFTEPQYTWRPNSVIHYSAREVMYTTHCWSTAKVNAL